ncbi:MAG TPA: ABC transporter substrate-binding protein [Anaerolineae bacterium]|nr:ABC transporter substrate-binding protein [Anaerolineae bacterium]
MKRLTALLAIVVIAGLVASCAPPTPEKIVETVVVTKVVEKPVEVTKIVEKPVEVVVTPTPVPKPAEFKIACGWDPPPVYHGNAFAPGGVGCAWWIAFEPLFYYIPLAEKYLPRLGVEYEETKEALTIKLREGVTWHDGTPFTSKDVWSTFMIGYLAKWEIWKYLDTIETPDDYTVVFRWKKPTPFGLKLAVAESIRWPYHLFGEFADKVDTTVATDEEPNASLIKELREYKKPELPIGTGPFKMEKPPTASEMVLVKYADHYLADKIDFDRFVALYQRRNEPWWAYLMYGDIDAGHPATAKDLWEQIMSMQPGMKMAFPTDLAGFCLAFNLRKAPFNELKFRQAIAYAIDRAKLAEVTYWAGLPVTDYATGLLESLREPWVPKDWMKENLTDYSYNPEKAAALLEELGYKKGPDGIWEDATGKDLKFGLVCHAGYSDWVLAIDNIASQLKEFGIIIEPETRPGAVYWKSIRAGEFELCMEWSMTSWRYAHPWAELRRTLHKDAGTGKTVDITAIDLIGPEGEVVDTTALVDELGVEFDVEKQKELIKKLAWIHNENLPVLPFVEKRLMIYHLDGVRATGWPDPEDPLWLLGPGGIERLYVMLMGEGILKAVR